MRIPDYPTSSNTAPVVICPEEVQKKIGLAVQNLRLAKNIRQEDLASLIDVSLKTVQSLEAGRSVSLATFTQALCILGDPAIVLEALKEPNFKHVNEEYEFYMLKKQPKRYSPTRQKKKVS